MLRDLFSEDFTFTKRHLGVMLTAAGVILLAATFAAEAVNSQSAGLGTMQKLGIVLGVASTLAGLTLLPLGSRPA